MTRNEFMKDKNKKEREQTVKEEVQDNSEIETCDVEEQPVCIEIDRDGMTDEQYIEALEQSLGQAIAQANECKSITQRLQADFDNYRKRNNAIAEDMKALGQSTVIERMLTVLDNCDLARRYIQDESALTGFNMMETQILNALKVFGLEEINAAERDFDAKYMTAVERIKDEKNQGKVVEVTAKGYTLNGRLLRPSSVKVGYWDLQ